MRIRSKRKEVEEAKLRRRNCVRNIVEEKEELR